MKDDPCVVCPQNEVDAEANRRQVGSDRYFSTEDVSGNNPSGTDTESPGRKYCNVCCVIGFLLYVCPRILLRMSLPCFASRMKAEVRTF